jgi:hypothetical protein
MQKLETHQHTWNQKCTLSAKCNHTGLLQDSFLLFLQTHIYLF